MVELERLLVRALTDRSFLERLKDPPFDPGSEYRLSDPEKEILKNLRELHAGQALDSVVHASAEAMAQLLPQIKSAAVSGAGFACVVPKLERVAPKLERVAPKLERVAPKLERVEPKLERVAPKLERVEPKLERVAAKLERVSAKLERAGQV